METIFLRSAMEPCTREGSAVSVAATEKLYYLVPVSAFGAGIVEASLLGYQAGERATSRVQRDTYPGAQVCIRTSSVHQGHRSSTCRLRLDEKEEKPPANLPRQLRKSKATGGVKRWQSEA